MAVPPPPPPPPPPAVCYALECKQRWADLILSGQKSLECRRWPPPTPELEGQKVWLLATSGEDGVATFGETVEAGSEDGKLLGWVLLDVDHTVRWDSSEAFRADEAQHCVPPDSPYAPAGGETVYGWRVVASHRLPEPLPVPAMQRVHRSVYRVVS